MNLPKCWKGLDAVTLEINYNIRKLCAINDNIYLLTSNFELYYGEVKEIDNQLSLSLDKYESIDVIDIGATLSNLYIVKRDGRLYRTTNFEDIVEVVLEEEAKSCSHGFKSPGCQMRVREVSVGEYGCLYVTETCELWASGFMPQVGVESEIPKRVLFFEGKIISAASVGNNFAMVLARKSMKYERESDSETSENVFVSNCPQCAVMSRLSSPVSMDTCPLGLHISKSTEDTSSGTNVSEVNEDSTSTEDSKRHKRNDNGEVSDKECDCVKKTGESEGTSNGIHNFITSEAARQFLTKQLSWVSAGEEYLADCTEKPTRIIKENVSNLTSLVYEGVKNLSRHMSGSDNDTLENADVLEVAEGNDEFPSKLYDFLGSCSTFSERENSEHDVCEKVQSLLKSGQNLLNSDLWTWGMTNHGQLGTGDNIKRSRPTVVSKLSGVGVKRIYSGHSHALALTLDGRAFFWGENNNHQIHSDSKTDQSFPKQFTSICNTDRVRDGSCGPYNSIILTHNLHLFYTGRHSSGITDKIIELYKYEDKTNVTDDVNIELKKINSKNSVMNKKYNNNYSNLYSNGLFTYCNSVNKTERFVSLEQTFLEELLTVQINITKPLIKKITNVLNDIKIFEVMCNRYVDILHITALNVDSFIKLTENHIEPYETILIAKFEELIHIYNEYLNSLCDVISSGGFIQIAKNIDVPQSVNQYYMPQNKQKKSNENVINYIFQHPLNRILTYKSIITDLFKNVVVHDKVAMEKRYNDIIAKLDLINDDQNRRIREADATKLFWEGLGKPIDCFRLPERRLIRDSRTNSLYVHNSSRFTTHWFVLLSDILLHVVNGNHNTYPLKTLWVESLQDADGLQNAITVTTPEESLVVYTPSPAEKMQWMQALQNAIKMALNKPNTHQPPIVRMASYSFTSKSVQFRDAKYSGRWTLGKMYGAGKLKWPDGRVYVGQFQNNQMQGFGRMENPTLGTYEGQWKEGMYNGYGIFHHANGDVYEGQFKDGLRHGHGVLRRGHFNSVGACIYVGEFVNGVKCGYGVLDDIANGEKYLGNWSDNKKNGCGLLVTLDGNYYEGVFMQDTLTGHGVVVFEDDSHYEGDLKGLQGPAGKGALSMGGRVLEGTLGGTWDNVKCTGNLKTNQTIQDKPSSFGKLSVQASQKWKSIFKHYQQILCSSSPTAETQKVWQNIAVYISNSRMENSMKTPGKKHETSFNSDDLDTIPAFGIDFLDKEVYAEVKQYLFKAFDSPTHPLYALLVTLGNAFTFTYGGVIVSPLLCYHALRELSAITQGLYQVVKALFPALPDTKMWLDKYTLVSPSALLHPIILPRLNSALFVLYALAHKEHDDSYWRRLCAWNVKDNAEVMVFLGIDNRFRGVISCELFQGAVESLQQIKTTFCAHHKLQVLRTTFKMLSEAVYEQLGTDFLLGMDTLFPLFLILVIRARILQLGSEVALIEDLLEQSNIYEKSVQINGNLNVEQQNGCIQNMSIEEHVQYQGEDDVMITTLKACYHQILQEKIYTNS